MFNKEFKISKISKFVSAFCFMGMFVSNVALANCRDDLKVYNLDADLYEQCVKEATSNNDSDLIYLVALWNFSGVHNKVFDKDANYKFYKKLMQKAADLGNPDAQSFYVMSEKLNKDDPKVAEYRKALATSQNVKSKIYNVQLKAMDGELENSDLDVLKDIAQKEKNPYAILLYTQIILNVMDPKHPERAEKELAQLETILSLPDNMENSSLKGQALWTLYNAYSRAEKAEVSSKSKKYLELLINKGDVLAMQKMAESYQNTQYGELSDSKALAYLNQAVLCSKDIENPSLIQFVTQKRDALKKTISNADLIKSEEFAKTLDIKCFNSNLITREQKKQNIEQSVDVEEQVIPLTPIAK